MVQTSQTNTYAYILKMQILSLNACDGMKQMHTENPKKVEGDTRGEEERIKVK